MSKYVSIPLRLRPPDAFRRFSHLYLEGIKVEWAEALGRFNTRKFNCYDSLFVKLQRKALIQAIANKEGK